MVRFSPDAEKASEMQAGEYLFKIYEAKEKVSQAGNNYWQVKFESKEGVKVCDNFMFGGKAAGKTLSLLTALDLADGENFPTKDLSVDDILGKFIYINTIKDKDSEFLKCPWGKSGYRKFEGKSRTKKAEVVEEDSEKPPF